MDNIIEFGNDYEGQLVSYLSQVRAARAGMGMSAEFKYAGFEDFLLKHGSFFTPKTTLPDGVRPMGLSQCFENAYRVATRTKAFHYVEGYALGVIPIHHAWLVDREGNVIDPTWVNIGVGKAYIGVEFNLAEVKKSRRVGILALSDDYRRDFPVLKGLPVFAEDAWHLRNPLTSQT